MQRRHLSDATEEVREQAGYQGGWHTQSIPKCHQMLPTWHPADLRASPKLRLVLWRQGKFCLRAVVFRTDAYINIYIWLKMYVCRFRFRCIQMSDLEFSANLHQKSICNTFIRHFISSLQVIRMSLGPLDQNTPGIADERTMHIDKHNSLKDWNQNR